MRTRWIALAGRTGSVLLVIGAVLALVAVTPPAPTGYTSSTGTSLRPGMYYGNPFTMVYSASAGLRLVTSSNDSLMLYLIEADYQEFSLWVEIWLDENFPDLDENQRVISTFNSTVLEAYVEAHPEEMLLEQEISGDVTTDYFPQSPTNVTAFFSNPSNGWVDMDVRLAGISGLVPRERVTAPTVALLVLGLILLIPRLATRLS
ncbi:MAG: hypothetical protein HXS50_01950 [Theionarchaea archaeon]|nr:hypothetical protein [Theionarchaea archaeon]